MENFVVIERLKALTYARRDARLYFWRTWSQKEIDLVEDRDGQLHAYEIKWNPKAKATCPTDFAHTYPDAAFTVISPNNMLEIIQDV